VVFRAEAGPAGPLVPASLRGAEDVATLVLERGTPFAHLGRPAVVDGRPGAFVALPDRVVSLVAFTIVGDRVTQMNLLVDPVKLQHVRLQG
jgi:RNA polymerase sigma-70 factor (ECF subfamily)